MHCQIKQIVLIISFYEENYTSICHINLINTSICSIGSQRRLFQRSVGFRKHHSYNKKNIKREFSIAYDRKVEFAKGNLQYQASTNTWRFAEHPWDYVGDYNKDVSPTYNGWIDIFGWGSGNDPIQTSHARKYYKVFNDWGDNNIINGNDKKWRTLSISEWNYVLYKRSTDSGIRFVGAEVGGVAGIIILPDEWNKSIYQLNDINTDNHSNSISKSEWSELFDNNGAVFLPEAGMTDCNDNYGGGGGFIGQVRQQMIIMQQKWCVFIMLV